jgi:hypothetical protein
MHVQTNVKAGGRMLNHNETLARAAARGHGPESGRTSAGSTESGRPVVTFGPPPP